MNIVARIKNILITPKPEWEVIKTENISVMDMVLKYTIILAAITPIAGFIGLSLVGVSTMFGNFALPVGFGIKYAIFTYIFSIAGVFITAFIIDFLAPNFGSTKDFTASMKVVVFAQTASWIAGIVMILPSLSIIATLAGIYTLVLMYWGLQCVKSVPKDKMVAYYVIVLIVAIVVYVLIGLLVNAIVFEGFNPYAAGF